MVIWLILGRNGNDNLISALGNTVHIFMAIHNMLFFPYVTDPSITQLTKIIEGEPEFKIVREGETITKVIHGGWYAFSNSICIRWNLKHYLFPNSFCLDENYSCWTTDQFLRRITVLDCIISFSLLTHFRSILSFYLSSCNSYSQDSVRNALSACWHDTCLS